MDYKANPDIDPRSFNQPIKPRIIIHGGAGNITRANLPPKSYNAYRTSLLSILSTCSDILSGNPNATALDVATHAVTLLENNPLFNAGKGAVFTRSGTNELESSVMVSRGNKKRGVGCMLMKYVRNPILLAREMLLRGDEEDLIGGGAGGHQQLSGEALEDLAKEWGLEMVDPSYFWTRRRWEEHLRGLRDQAEDLPESGVPVFTGGDGVDCLADISWDGHEYLPQGTVGAVALDSTGTVCVATSTGGLTNKLPGRIGDTPTLGAGFWAEEWQREFSNPEPPVRSQMLYKQPFAARAPILDSLSRGNFADIMKDCLPGLASSRGASETSPRKQEEPTRPRTHALSLSGTGNGDSFLRIGACHLAVARARFLSDTTGQDCVSIVAGPGGDLEQSAEDRWGRTGEGEGGMIGIELVGGQGNVVYDFNCGGMFRAWVDDEGKQRMMVFREEYENC